MKRAQSFCRKPVAVILIIQPQLVAEGTAESYPTVKEFSDRITFLNAEASQAIRCG